MADNEQDLSSFMCILIMTIGCLVILLVTNILVIISNPENVQLTAVIKKALDDGGDENDGRGAVGVPKFGNKSKQPTYIDVHPNYLVVYPSGEKMDLADLAVGGNVFEKTIRAVEKNRQFEYIVLLLRPGSATAGNRLRRMIQDRGIDIGQELFEAFRDISLADEAPEEKTEEPEGNSTNEVDNAAESGESDDQDSSDAEAGASL